MRLNVHHISEFFENWAPNSTQAEYDNSGLLVGSQKQNLTGVLTCLDVTEAVVDEAISRNCNLIVAHHPLIFQKIARINPDTSQGSLLYKLIKNDISVLAAHTNLDTASNGVSFVLADVIGLENCGFLTYHDQAETYGYGAVGVLGKEMHQTTFLQHVAAKLGTNAVRYSGEKENIRTVAVCGGTGVSLASAARRAGADAFITADIKYHEYFDSADLLLVDAGHYETEVPIVKHLQKKLSMAFDTLPVFATSVITNPMKVHVNKNFQN